VWGVASKRPATLLFLSLAVLPPLCATIISTIGRRPIIQERYLAFGQFGMCLAWAAIVTSLPAKTLRWVLCSVLLGVASFGVFQYLRALPSKPPAVRSAVRLLKDEAFSNDLVIVPTLQALNILKYYATQEGIPNLQVRHRGMSFPAKRHVPHLASVQFNDFLWPGWDTRSGSRRLWWTKRRTFTFLGNGDYMRGSSLFDLKVSEYINESRGEGAETVTTSPLETTP